jgi:hypothetical protein
MGMVIGLVCGAGCLAFIKSSRTFAIAIAAKIAKALLLQLPFYGCEKSNISPKIE